MGRSGVVSLSIVVGILLGIAGVALYVWWFSPPQPLALAPKGSDIPDPTEAVFQHYVDKSNAIALTEWTAAREDHRRVARAVVACKHAADFDTISTGDFSALFLDLTPAGSHIFVTHDANGSSPSGLKTATTVALTPPEVTLLGLSDTIARTRMSAASEADSNVPGVRWLGIVTLVVSALATLFVTVQGRMRPQPVQIVSRSDGEHGSEGSAAPSPPTPQPSATEGTTGTTGETEQTKATLDDQGGNASPPEPPTPPAPPTSPPPAAAGAAVPQPRSQRDTFYEFFAYGAIVLSVAGTALTGVRQFYDPSRAYAQNEHALLELRRLHEQIGTAAGQACVEPAAATPSGTTSGPHVSGGIAVEPKEMTEWTERAAGLRAQIIPAFAALPLINQGSGDTGH